MDRRTCKLSRSGEGLWRCKVFLAATFLTAVLFLVGARGAAGPEDALLLGAGFGEIGWLCITTFFKGGMPLQKRTTGAGGTNAKGEPSAFVGAGPSCCCEETEQGYKNNCRPFEGGLRVVAPVLRGYHIQHRVVSTTVPELS